jgi:hypothetical protein
MVRGLVVGLLALTIQAQVNAPEALAPPKGQTLLLHLRAKGKQIYVCQTSDGGPAWKLKAPEAKLYDESGKYLVHHFAGPTWQADDGSQVVGKAVANAPSPDGDSIPWLLLTVTTHDGKGILSGVQSIQRLETKGGKAPAGGCGTANQNELAEAPYEAAYYFWGAR